MCSLPTAYTNNNENDLNTFYFFGELQVASSFNYFADFKESTQFEITHVGTGGEMQIAKMIALIFIYSITHFSTHKIP